MRKLRLEPNQQAAVLMLGSMAAFTFNDTLVKLAGATVPLWQIIVARGALASILLLGLAASFGALRFNFGSRDWLLVTARSGMEALATYLFLTALLEMPMANVSAILQILPLTVTLAAALVLGERVGWRRYVAIAVGLVGMLLIVRPGGSSFGSASIYALGAVCALTIRELCTRKMSPHVPSLTVTFLAALTVTGFGFGLGLQNSWEPMGWYEWQLIGAMAVLILLAYLFAVMTVRVGEMSAVAPLRYSALLWALLLGWLVFGDWPDLLTVIGSVIVVLAGVFTMIRQRRRA